MPFSFTTDDLLIARWDGSNFNEEALDVQGLDGITITLDSTATFTISGNQSTLSGALSNEIDSDIAAYSGYAEGAFVNVVGDTMTGFLTLHADPTVSGHAATKQYVDSQISSAQISIEDNNSFVVSGTTLNFAHALDVVDAGGGQADIAVDESEFTTVVFLTGNQTISGVKTFANNVNMEGNLLVEGDLTVSGTTTYLNTEQLLVEDNIITLNSTHSGTPTLDAGIEVNRGSSTYAQLLWDEGLDCWTAGISGALECVVLQSELTALSGDLTAYSGYAEGAFVNVVGDTMTGFLTLHADPTVSGHAATKQYVDNSNSTLSGNLSNEIDNDIAAYSGYAEGAFVNVVGDTMTGFLTLHADPTASGHAATKQYVDAEVAALAADATVNVYDNGVEVVASGAILNFAHALDVTISGGDQANISVDESEFTTVVFLTGDQSINGQKTFLEPIVTASGVEPATISGAGDEGEIRWSDDYMYVCVATNSWKRIALAVF